MCYTRHEGDHMKRKLMNQLIAWKQNKERKPLILQGSRQVGKTFLLLEFGKSEYDHIAYFNFETTPTLNKIFDESLDPEYLIASLSRSSKVTISKERTLIILDEVQLCERALTSLKYFCEIANDYHICVAGSLLGVAVARSTYAFPVGKVDMLTLYPMDFEEFLWAYHEDELVMIIRNHFENCSPLPDAMHQSALQYYREYLICGGMPECVEKYERTQNEVLLRHSQDMILESYLNDMSKYNTNNEIKKTRQTYDSITVQLSRQNTRFLYKLIKKGGRASEFENAIEWLQLSGIITKITRVDTVKKPLDNYKDIDAFKIYVSDTGLLCAKKDIIKDDILYDHPDLQDFKGGLCENYVVLQLIANGYHPYYYTDTKGVEIDFLIQKQGHIIPIEVKSSNNTSSKSLHHYINQFAPSYAIRLSTKNFGTYDNIISIPLYAAFCI